MSQQWGKSEISWHNGCGYIEIWGDINQDNIDAVYHALSVLPLGLYVLMADVEIDEGPVLAHLISALRLIKPTCLIEAPRMLAHTLYKINALKDIQLSKPRSY